MSTFNLKNRDSGTCDSILEERCARAGDWSEVGDSGGCVGLERGAEEGQLASQLGLPRNLRDEKLDGSNSFSYGSGSTSTLN